MLKCFCDRCGKELKEYPGELFMTGYVAVNFREGYDGSMLDSNPFERSNFCRDCIAEISDFIRKGGKKENEDLH